MHTYGETSSNVHSGYASSSKNTNTAEVEGLWLVNEPKHFVLEYPDNSNNSPRGLVILSIYRSLPFLTQEILMMSHSDIMIVCSIFPVGKPLCMCIQTTIVHLQICQCPHWNPLLLEKLQTSSSFFKPISVPVTLSPRYFSVPLYQSLVY